MGLTLPLVGLSLAAAASPLVLIDRLGHAAYVEREAAQVALSAAGPWALPALIHAAESHTDGEVRGRAAACAARVRDRADQAPLLAPTTITLHFVATPLAMAVAEVRAKTGLNLTLDPTHPTPTRPITFSTGPLPAWEAAEAFRVAAGLTERDVAELTDGPPGPASSNALNQRIAGGAMRVQSHYPADAPPAARTASQVPVVWADGADLHSLPADRTGAIRVRALPADFPAHKVLRGSGQILLALDVTPPAGLAWATGATVRIRHALDDTGRPVTIARTAAASPVETAGGLNANVFLAPGGVVMFNGGINPMWIDGSPAPAAGRQANPRLVLVPLRTDDRAIKTLTVMTGTVVGTVMTPNVPVVTIPDLATAVGQPTATANGGALTVVGFHTSAGVTTVTLAWEGVVRFGPQGADEVFRDPLGTDGSVRFRDAAGSPVAAPTRSSGSSTSINIGNGIMMLSNRFEYMFPAGVAPAAVTLMGTRPVLVEVPFTLRGVPLP